RRLGVVGGRPGHRFHPERDRQGAALQRTRDAMRALVVAAALAMALAQAQAGRACEARPPQAVNVQRALELAQRTQQALDGSGAQVVVLGRAGQDLGKWGLRWSHLGYAYRSDAGWRVVHKLNQCGSANAALYRQG